MKGILPYLHPRRFGWPVLAVLLYLLSLLVSRLYSDRNAVAREVRKAETYLARHQRDFEKLISDTALLIRLSEKTESPGEFQRVVARTWGLFLYRPYPNNDPPRLQFWNKQLATPPDDVLSAADGLYTRRLTNGWYVILRRTVATGREPLLALAVIPVQSRFFIETDYLPESFYFSKTADKRVRISSRPTPYAVLSREGTPAFYLERKAAGAVAYNDRASNLLRFTAVFFLLLFVIRYSRELAKKRGAWWAIGWLGAALFGLRLSTYLFPGLLNLRQFEFFSPLIYGSNFIQRSLGDLLINAALACWWVLFAWSQWKDHSTSDPLRDSRWSRVRAVGVLGLLLYSTFTLADLIRSLVADSKISFDVTDFFSLNLFTVAGFLVLTLLSLTYFFLSRLLYGLLRSEASWLRPLWIYFGLALGGLIYLSLRPRSGEVLFFLPVLCWLLGYTFLMNHQDWLARRLRINFAGVLWWIFLFSASIATIMLTQNDRVELARRKSIAEKLAVQTDPSSEMLMSIAVKYLDDKFLADNFHRFYQEQEGRVLRDSIIAGNYSGFLNKYDTRLYVYDSLAQPLYNDDPVTYEALNIIYTEQGRPTATEGLYYYETSFDRFNYIIRRELRDTAGRKLGYFFIVSNLKNFSRDAIFPELFRKNKKADPENSPIYSNAVYIRGRLVSPPGNYPFATWLGDRQVPEAGFSQRSAGDYNELWYRASKEKVVVVARKKETLLETITLFSYIFCSFLFVVGLLQLLLYLLRTGWSLPHWRQFWHFNIRSQVHSTILFISVFSFLIIGAATISFFISRNRQSNSEKLSRTMKIMVNEMEKKMSAHSSFDDVVKVYDSVPGIGLQQLADEVSDIHGVDVNVYDLEGNLKVSSEANVYNKGVLSKKMEPSAFYHLDRLRQVQHVQEEKVGAFSYLSIYAPVRDEEGRVQAYVNIPYFTSRTELRQEISNFLVTVINLNAFIFLLAGLIALFITNRITSSFSLISDKMKEVQLDGRNEAIVWNRNDEIGQLVQEYNKMVAKLSASAAALAKSEREGAWREMARQVAHEIKNPLTPMKLGIQYLQKAINNNQDNVKELTASVAGTLVEQIDHLSRIAADFSQFANIGNSQGQQFDLHEVIASVRELFSANPNLELTWFPVLEPLPVWADKTQLNRLFTNLLTNATEACPEGVRCQVQVNEQVEPGHVIISIRDNGAGIPPAMQEKIFTPNFTTKSSGTGLGLAMCKGIVEQARGEIWFETEPGKGTVFYVKLPLTK